MTALRRRVAATALVLLAPTVTACGFGVQTDQDYQPAIGVNHRSGPVAVLNAVVVEQSEGKGVFVATLVNKSTTDPATLVSVKGTGTTGYPAALNNLEIAPEGLLNLGDEEQQIAISDDSVTPGGYNKVTLEFKDGHQVEVNAPVVEATDQFEEFGTPAPSPSSSPASPSAPASGTPSESPSASASDTNTPAAG